ncbi:hypothetical protein OESDEN_12335 [Oesophagostomum dentatum]|uniref:Uncharacterized protein n=1 Tax=Oesophagostomum dentatum TaxID=61180 RepID=A0A0B1SXE7_OESDE|nr:hypothetical protein OESDEN_12335 [Oesophagostomum dentatum]
MLLLKDSLKGKSDSAIKGIQLVPQSYNWMIDALKKNYDNKTVNRIRIVRKLTFLRTASNAAESCSYVHDKITMLISQMVSAEQDIRKTKDAMWTETMLQKFPYKIVRNVLLAMKERDELFVEDVMQQTESEISAKFHPGRTSTVNDEELLRRIKANPEATTRELAVTLGCCQCTTVAHPYNLDIRKVMARWIPSSSVGRHSWPSQSQHLRIAPLPIKSQGVSRGSGDR